MEKFVWIYFVGLCTGIICVAAREHKEKCPKTNGGNAKGACCKFPFMYKGTEYTKCTTVGYHRMWCATKSNDGKSYSWGNCPTEGYSWRKLETNGKYCMPVLTEHRVSSQEECLKYCEVRGNRYCMFEYTKGMYCMMGNACPEGKRFLTSKGDRYTVWQREKSTKRLGDDTGYCITSNRCGIGEGDCDADSECMSGLECGINNCDKSISSFDSTDDCCYKRTDTNDHGPW